MARHIPRHRGEPAHRDRKALLMALAALLLVAVLVALVVTL